MNPSFDPLYQPYASNRYCVTARNGMVCSGSNLATAAGLEVLRKGGNAVDAAIATAACLTVVEPSCNGLGSDAFAIVWMKDKMYGLNSTGYAPSDISIEKVKAQVTDGKMPVFGWTPVTVPGAPKAWAALNERFGNLSLEEDLTPAIRYAEEGYHLSPMLAIPSNAQPRNFMVSSTASTSTTSGSVSSPKTVKATTLATSSNFRIMPKRFVSLLRPMRRLSTRAKSPRPLWLRVSGMAASSLRKT